MKVINDEKLENAGSLLIDRALNQYKLTRDQKLTHVLEKLIAKENSKPDWLMIEHLRGYVRMQFPTLSQDTVREWSRIGMTVLLEMREKKIKGVFESEEG